MSKLSENIIARLDEFTARQGIISAEWCMLLDVTEEHFQSLELELARNRKTIEYGDSVVDRLELELASTKKMLDEALKLLKYYSQGGNPSQDTWHHEGLGYFSGKQAKDFLAKHEKNNAS